jgi:hypothetical protein
MAILRSVNEPGTLANILIISGTLTQLNGNYVEARALIDEGVANAQVANDPWFTAYGIYNLGHIDRLMGGYQKG